jgi:hypothetical protein
MVAFDCQKKRSTRYTCKRSHPSWFAPLLCYVEKCKTRSGVGGRKRKSDVLSEDANNEVEETYNNGNCAEMLVPTDANNNQTNGSPEADDECGTHRAGTANDLFQAENEKMKEKNETLQHELNNLEQENDLLRVEDDMIKEYNESLQHQVFILKSKLRELEQEQNQSETTTNQNSHFSVNSLSVDDTPVSRFQREITQRDRQIRELQGEISCTKKKLHDEQKRHSKTRKALEQARLQRVARSDEQALRILFEYMNKQSKHMRRTEESVAASFARNLWSGNGLTESLLTHVRHAIVSLGQQWYAEHVFSPQNLLRLMDLNGGTISMQAIDVLRSLETEGELYVRGTILPSSSSIGRCAKICELFASSNLPFVEGTIEGTGGEFVEFQFDELLVSAIDAFGLSSVAKRRSVEIHVSIDGAQITNNVVHIMFGFKVADVEAVCPFTHRPLFMEGNPQLIQSCNLCIPVKIAIHKETAAIYKEFWHLLDQFVKFGKPFSDSDEHALKRMQY